MRLAPVCKKKTNYASDLLMGREVMEGMYQSTHVTDSGSRCAPTTHKYYYLLLPTTTYDYYHLRLPTTTYYLSTTSYDYLLPMTT